MSKHSITAVFDDRKQADQAVARVKELGVPASDVTVLPAGDRGGQYTTGDVEEKGFWASLGDMFGGADDRETYAEGLRRGGTVVSVRAEDSHLDRIVDVLEKNGSVNLDERETSWRNEGWTGATATGADRLGTAPVAQRPVMDRAAPVAPSPVAGRMAPVAPLSGGDRTAPARAGSDDKLQVYEERLAVGKRTVSGGKVRVHTRVVENEASADVKLRDENVTIERNKIDRPVEAGADPFAERTIELEQFREEAVVGKTAHLVEEISLHKDATDRVETIHDTVRSTKVEIDDQTGRTAALGAERVRADMEVVGTDGAHVGKVDHMDGGRIKLKKDDSASGGVHHYLPMSDVKTVGDKVVLAMTAAEARTRWTTGS